MEDSKKKYPFGYKKKRKGESDGRFLKMIDNLQTPKQNQSKIQKMLSP